MLPELKLTRLELNDLQNSIHWSPDGTLVVNSMTELTFLTPNYTKNEVKTADPLFEVKKLTVNSLPSNNFFAQRVGDERSSTFLTTLEDYVVALKWSPLVNNESYLAVLTSQLSLVILKNREIFAQLNTTKKFTTQNEFNQYRVHCFDWIEHYDNLSLIQGTHSGDLRIFDLTNGKEVEVIKVCDSPIVMLKTLRNLIFAVSSSNEIFKVEQSEVQRLKTSDRFMIYDLYPQDDMVYYTTCSKITKLELFRRTAPITLNTGLLTYTQIVPSRDDLLLISETSSIKVDSSFSIVPDDIISPVFFKRLQSWTRKYNDFNTKSVSLHKFGSTLNQDGNVLATIYELQHDATYKYIIASDRLYKVIFIPLYNNFEGKGSSLANYHEFLFTGHINQVEQQDINLDFEVDFKIYLQRSVYRNSELSQLASKNLIFRDINHEIRKKYASLIVSYIDKNKISITNKIDEAVVASMRFFSGLHVIHEVKDVVIKGNAFSENFNFGNDQDTDTLVSATDHIWPRCAITFLPILTPFVKVDPATEKRVLDISRDSLNEYGPITKDILESSDVCIYSGCRYAIK
jgi:transcription factor C subunit 8